VGPIPGYLGRYTQVGAKEIGDLHTAIKMCMRVKDCGGVTKAGKGKVYTLRAEDEVRKSPSKELSWIIKCDPEEKMPGNTPISEQLQRQGLFEWADEQVELYELEAQGLSEQAEQSAEAQNAPPEDEIQKLRRCGGLDSFSAVQGACWYDEQRVEDAYNFSQEGSTVESCMAGCMQDPRCSGFEIIPEVYCSLWLNHACHKDGNMGGWHSVARETTYFLKPWCSKTDERAQNLLNAIVNAPAAGRATPKMNSKSPRKKLVDQLVEMKQNTTPGIMDLQVPSYPSSCGTKRRCSCVCILVGNCVCVCDRAASELCFLVNRTAAIGAPIQEEDPFI